MLAYTICKTFVLDEILARLIIYFVGTISISIVLILISQVIRSVNTIKELK